MRLLSRHDDERISGATWYEISRFPHSFERGLVGVTATYSRLNNGRIRVVKRGFKGSLEGKASTATGKAKVPDPAKPGRLKVSFFLFFYAEYLVMELDVNYGWAVVGSSGPGYLWILSRTPRMDPVLFNALVEKAEKRGYDISRLIRVEQPR